MRKFDTKVQLLKYKVLKEVAQHLLMDKAHTCYHDIPYTIVTGTEPTMRCCVYKERAIVGERIHLAMGGNEENPNEIEVIDIACDECPVSSYWVTESCRGCIAHRCEGVCPVGAISYDKNQKANIDSNKCLECGKCASVCPYSAIIHNKRPCEKSCKVKAITMDANKKAKIDNEKCIACGACVYQCPFGAIMDKSYILDAVKILKSSYDNRNYRVYAIVAPSIASQFGDVKLGQVISAIKGLGFYGVEEAALGADMIIKDEAKELVEKGLLLSSCCPSFVDYVKKQFPEMADKLSHSPSPMVAIAKKIKEKDINAKIIFIGPCTSKKAEMKLDGCKEYIDCVLTFEELQALIDAKDIELENLPEDSLDDASYFGRIIARTGGLSEGIVEGLKEQGYTDFDFKPVVCDGIEACKTTLLKASKGAKEGNFIEGMACVGGCIGGAGSLTHGEKNKKDIDDYGKQASKNKIC